MSTNRLRFHTCRNHDICGNSYVGIRASELCDDCLRSNSPQPSPAPKHTDTPDCLACRDDAYTAAALGLLNVTNALLALEKFFQATQQTTNANLLLFAIKSHRNVAIALQITHPLHNPALDPDATLSVVPLPPTL